MILSVHQLGYWKNSIALNSHAVSVTRNNYFSHTSLGDALAEQGRYEEAIEHYREAIKINPLFTNAYINLGIVEAVRGNTDKAVSLLSQSHALSPENIAATKNLALICARQGQTALIEFLYCEITIHHPEKTELIESLRKLRVKTD